MSAKKSREMFNESLRKVNEQQPPTIMEEDETPRRVNRPPDLQGFSILDERWRSSSDDSDDSLPVGSYISTTSTPGRFCKSVDFRPLRRETPPVENTCSTLPSTPVNKNPPTMATGGSRFKVVPVETRDPYFSPGKNVVSKPAAVIKKEEIVNRSSRSLSDIHPSSSPIVSQIPVAQPPKPMAPFITANPRPVFTIPKAAPTAQIKTSTVVQPAANGQIKVSSETQINGVGEPRRTKSVAASPPANNLNNIDNKIEQAMDLVKTHLMFAVREEVDGLRSKIFDLENHVRRLESENAILKRTIPNDTLKQLHLKL
ncbi:unnamed protein product [Caenorhabditis sp. 36 PRJEB53466]|nr:unnamed protein product [Caenorhabditis sp. 36 PRJEB53466]